MDTTPSANSLEEFRKIIRPAYIRKGIKPPRPESEEERALFQQWLRGKEKLDQTRKESNQP